MLKRQEVVLIADSAGVALKAQRGDSLLWKGGAAVVFNAPCENFELACLKIIESLITATFSTLVTFPPA